MRFYAMCRSHANERVYLQFQNVPATRDQVPRLFHVTCPSGTQQTFGARDVVAEAGPAILLGAAVGAVLFLLDPLLGLLGLLGGAIGGGMSEKEKVDRFNSSTGFGMP